MTEVSELQHFMLLLQLSAVTAVASVLILGVSADLFGLESTGVTEPGGRQVLAIRYRGRNADNFRHMVFAIGLFLATAYTPLLLFVIVDAIMVTNLFSPALLMKVFITVVGLTIIAVTWIAFFAILLRWWYMRNAGPNRTQ
jgi:hypothetical protein